ncbi:MAG: APC family permease, partial [Acinetobacter sp.]|nr:APC family permease [Acinetobacter sp.]
MAAQQGLNRTLKLSWVYAMAVGSAVGWGAFVLPYQWLSSAGLVAVLVGFLIGTLLISIVAINYGYATRKLPVTGGGVVFALTSLGRMHGFIAGWSLILGYMGIVALNASAVTLVLRLIIPDVMQQFPLYQVSDWVIYAPEVAVSSLFLIAFAYLNIKNTAISGKIQFIAVLLMLLAVAIIFTSTGFHFLNQQQVTLALLPPRGTSFWAAAMSIIAFAPWAYIGFDSIPQMAGEFNFTAQKIMRLLIGSVLSATLLYVAMVCASAFAFGADLNAFSQVAWAVGTAVDGVMGKIGLVLLVIAVSMGVLTGLNGFYISSSRVLLTMGRSQMLPASFAQLHPKYGTPYVAILTVMAVCLISPWFGRAALLWIVDMT